MSWDKPLVRQETGMDAVCIWKIHGKYYLGVETSDYREELTLDQVWELAQKLVDMANKEESTISLSVSNACAHARKTS